tara:strand:+ start:428 stop:991 length:564 start_codon:yes stop_codon:yes gene_type:complete
MPNAILRAGPDTQGRPVNCANDTSSSAWPWQYIEKVNVGTVTHTGCQDTPNGEEPVTESSNSNDSTVVTATGNFSKSRSAGSNHGTSVSLGFEFSYQATQSFDIKITFNASASGNSGNIVFFDSVTSNPITGFPSLSNSVNRTLPASVVPASYFATLGAEAQVPFAEDVCSPSGSASASATLEIEFL